MKSFWKTGDDSGKLLLEGFAQDCMIKALVKKGDSMNT